MKKKCLYKGLLLAALLTLEAGASVYAAEIDYSHVATSGDTAKSKSVSKYGMMPIYAQDIKEGTYEIEVKSSSSKFRIEKAELTVKEGEMEASITLSGKGYLCLYMGTGEEAAQAAESDYIPFEEADGWYSYTVPVEALDKEISCAAFSKRKEKWYDRTLLFDASTLPEGALEVTLPDYDLIDKAVKAYEESQNTENEESKTSNTEIQNSEVETAESQTSASGDTKQQDSGAETAEDQTSASDDTDLQTSEAETAEIPNSESDDTDLQNSDPVTVDLEDGDYSIEVTLTGGSGKATVSSPTILEVKDGKAYAQLTFSSTNYDYMKVGDEQFLNENPDGYSKFTIPITEMDVDMPVIADTTAMGGQTEIHYMLHFYEQSIGSKDQLPQEAAKKVVLVAFVIIVGGAILNSRVKKKRRA